MKHVSCEKKLAAS